MARYIRLYDYEVHLEIEDCIDRYTPLFEYLVTYQYKSDKISSGAISISYISYTSYSSGLKGNMEKLLRTTAAAEKTMRCFWPLLWDISITVIMMLY